MDLIQEYLTLAEAVVSYRESVYDAASAEIHNCKVKRMESISVEIERIRPELKVPFSKLMYHDNNEICLWVAHHILEIMNYDQQSRKMALKVIRYKARTDKSAHGYGEKLWLKEWYKSHPKDRWFLI